MTYRLFWCEACTEYSLFATAHISAKAEVTIYPHEGDTLYVGSLVLPVQDASDLRCSKCGNPVELLRLEKCPHIWQVIEHKFYRQCRVCKVIQKAMMVFEEE